MPIMIVRTSAASVAGRVATIIERTRRFSRIVQAESTVAAFTPKPPQIPDAATPPLVPVQGPLAGPVRKMSGAALIVAVVLVGIGAAVLTLTFVTGWLLTSVVDVADDGVLMLFDTLPDTVFVAALCAVLTLFAELLT